MAFTPNLYTSFLLVATVCLLLPQAHAFGAGDIPDFAYLNDKAFRHGDIESVLESIAKTAGGAGGLYGLATSMFGASKFNKNDIKKIYFGNWLRDYSQAVDIAGLSKLSADTLVLVVSVLGFMTFGFATQEFEITAERLGCYLPVEHIDNPKGYAEKEGDARRYDSRLRPPVDPRELEIDPQTGMKNYMASDGQGWDTSTAFIRRTFTECIKFGRRAKGREGADLWEAYRLLGTGLHTLEDLTAHSNWCELALRKMGYSEVFCHVGDRVLVNTPNGRAPPMITGTFGGADFLHSLLGEAGDKLSQASVTDLSGKLSQAQSGENSAQFAKLKAILRRILGSSGGGDEDAELAEGQNMEAAAQGYNFDPNNIAPPEVQQKLLDLLRWHDDVMRNVARKLAMVPGLENLLEEFSNALNAYIYTLLAPYLVPILSEATGVLDEGSKAVIDNDDQYEVFNNPNASDPSHSLLSKDHFGLILNEPAGKIAQIIVEHTVPLIVEAWSNRNDPNTVIDEILEAFHHPYYATGRSQIQRKMFAHMEKWIGGLGSDEARQTIAALTKESVREHKNKRLGSEDQDWSEAGYGACGHAHGGSKTCQTGSGNAGKTKPSYGGGREDYASNYGRQETTSRPSYGRQDDTPSYGGGYAGGRQDDSPSYDGGRQNYTPSYGGGYGGGRQDQSGGFTKPTVPSYGGRQEQTSPTYGGGYGGRRDESSPQRFGNKKKRDEEDEQPNYGGGYGGGRKKKDDDDDNAGYKPSYGGGGYGGQRDESSPQRYGRKKKDEDEDEYKPKYGGGGYGQRRDESPQSFGGRKKKKDEDDEYKPSYGGGGYGGQRRAASPQRSGGRKKKNDDDDEYKPESEGEDDDSPGRRYATRSGDKKKKKDGSDDDKPKYGRGGGGDSEDEKKRRKAGKKSKSSSGSSDDDSPKKKKGYQPSYGKPPGGYGGRDDTFGAERMKIKDSDDEDDRKKRYGGGRRW